MPTRPPPITLCDIAKRAVELGDEPSKILRLAARAEWKGRPPQSMREWLAERGVGV